MTIRRIVVAAALALTLTVVLAPAARADDSQIRISEVYSDAAATKGDFIEFQLAAAGQQLTAGHTFRLYNPNASAIISFDFPASTIASTNNATVLLGWDTNPNADFQVGAGLNPPAPGGAACLLASGPAVVPGTPIDCVSWGTFAGNNSPNFPGGAAGAAAAPLNVGQSLTRTIAPNCPTLFEAADDTNSSAADFFLTAPSPRNNGVFPTEFGCLPPASPTNATAAAKKKCKKKKRGRSAAVAKKKRCKTKKK
jgi:hypothetical protein